MTRRRMGLFGAVGGVLGEVITAESCKSCSYVEGKGSGDVGGVGDGYKEGGGGV